MINSQSVVQYLTTTNLKFKKILPSLLAKLTVEIRPKLQTYKYIDKFKIYISMKAKIFIYFIGVKNKYICRDQFILLSSKSKLVVLLLLLLLFFITSLSNRFIFLITQIANFFYFEYIICPKHINNNKKKIK